MTVLRGWRDGTQGPILRQMHKAACGPFGTVLGRDQVSRAFRQLSFDERAVLLLHYLIGLQPDSAAVISPRGTASVCGGQPGAGEQ